MNASSRRFSHGGFTSNNFGPIASPRGNSLKTGIASWRVGTQIGFGRDSAPSRTPAERRRTAITNGPVLPRNKGQKKRLKPSFKKSALRPGGIPSRRCWKLCPMLPPSNPNFWTRRKSWINTTSRRGIPIRIRRARRLNTTADKIIAFCSGLLSRPPEGDPADSAGDGNAEGAASRD